MRIKQPGDLWIVGGDDHTASFGVRVYQEILDMSLTNIHPRPVAKDTHLFVIATLFQDDSGCTNMKHVWHYVLSSKVTGWVWAGLCSVPG